MKLHFKLDGPFGTMHCDNERALGKASIYRRRIPSGSKHADLLRLLRSIKHDLQHAFTYHHIYGHADKKKLWHQLTLVEKLNVLCDNWAKGARLQGSQSTRDTNTQSLPREKAAIFIRGIKATGDLADLACFELGLKEARQFYINELGWFEEAFDSVEWLSLDFTLSKKSKMYAIWLAKQASGFLWHSPHDIPLCWHLEWLLPQLLTPGGRLSLISVWTKSAHTNSLRALKIWRIGWTTQLPTQI